MWRQLKNLNVDVPGCRGDARKGKGNMPGKTPGKCRERCRGDARKKTNAGKVRQATCSKVIMQQALFHRYETKRNRERNRERNKEKQAYKFTSLQAYTHKSECGTCGCVAIIIR